MEGTSLIRFLMMVNNFMIYYIPVMSNATYKNYAGFSIQLLNANFENVINLPGVHSERPNKATNLFNI